MIHYVYVALAAIFVAVLTYMVVYNLRMKKKEREILGRPPVNTQEGMSAVEESDRRKS